MKVKQAKARGRIRRYLIGGFFLLLLSAAAAGTWVLKAALVQPLTISEDGLRFEVSSGSNLSRVLRELEGQGVLKWRRLVLAYAYWQNQADIHAGEYFFPRGTNAMDLVGRLNRGDVVRYRLTLVEGWTFRQALAHVRASRGIVPSEMGSTVESATRALGFAEGESPEGWIFPDTYIYRSGTSDISLLRQRISVCKRCWMRNGGHVPITCPIRTPTRP